MYYYRGYYVLLIHVLLAELQLLYHHNYYQMFEPFSFFVYFQECPTGIVNEDTFKEIYAQFFPQGGTLSKHSMCSSKWMLSCASVCSLVRLSALLSLYNNCFIDGEKVGHFLNTIQKLLNLILSSRGNEVLNVYMSLWKSMLDLSPF